MIVEYVDVSLLPPPEPMQVILASLATLADGHYLQIKHSRKPYPLLTILDEQGFNWHFAVFNNMEQWLWIWGEGQTLSSSCFVQPTDDLQIEKGSR